MKISKEVKTGVLILLGIFLFVFGFNYLKGKNLFESSNTYYTEFDYNALTKSSPVTINGNVVGKIQDINYNFDTNKTRVYFTVNDALKFSKKTIVKIYETGLMGGNGLALLINKEGEMAKSGDALPSQVEQGLVSSLSKNFSGLSGDLNTTLKSTDTLMISLNSLVNDKSSDGLQHTISELNKTLKSFKNTSNSLNSVISKNEESITTILEKFKTTSSDLSTLVSQLKNADLGKTTETLNTTLNQFNSLLETTNKGEGTLGKVFKDKNLYNNLEGVTKEMESLLKDIKLHPKRYFRILSKKEIPYKEE